MSTNNDNHGKVSNTQLIVIRWQEFIKKKIVEWAGGNGKEVDQEQYQELLLQVRQDLGAVESEADRYARELLKEHKLDLLTSRVGVEFLPPPHTVDESVASGRTEKAATTQAPWCPVCLQFVGQQDKFCPSCSVDLLCPLCQRRFQEGKKFCGGCGFDTGRVRQCHEQMILGRQFFQLAISPISLEQRLDHADNAKGAFCKALGFSPDNKKAKNEHREAQNLYVRLLHQSSDEARQSGRLGQAVRILERMRRESFLQQAAAKTIQEIQQVRDHQFRQALEDGGNGQWYKAIQALTSLLQQFPEDAEIAGRLGALQEKLAEYRKKKARAHEIVGTLIPKLREEKRIAAILPLLKELENDQVNVKELPAAKAVFQEALDAADRAADTAEEHLQAGRPGDALVALNSALVIVADHDRALAIRARVDECNRLRHQLDREIKGQRWFLARETLARLQGRYDAQKQVIDIGVARVNEFCCFVLWAAAAGLLLLLAARMSNLLVKDLVREQRLTTEAIFRQLLGPAVALTSLSLCAFLLVAFVTCFFRAMSWKTAVGLLGVIAATVAVGSLTWSAVANYWLHDSESFVGKTVSFASSVLTTALFGALLGYVAVVLADNVLSDTNRWYSPLHAHALASGAICFVVCVASSAYKWVLFQNLPLAFLFFGFLMLAGLVHTHTRFYRLVLASVVVSGISGSLGLEHDHWLSLLMTGSIFFAAGSFISQDRRPLELVRIAILAAVVLWADQFFVGDARAPVLIPTFFFVCGGMACERFKMPDYDRCLHVLDRGQVVCRAWSRKLAGVGK